MGDSLWGLRIVRICSDNNDRDRRLAELKERLISRQYPEQIVESAIQKARSVKREHALKKQKKKKQTNRPVLALPFDPRLPAIPSTIAKHWRTMGSQDSYLREVFQEPPLTAFRRQKNLRSHIIRAKVARKQRYPKRYLKGMSKCGSDCTACPFIKEGNKLTINGTNWKLMKRFDCYSYNLVYAIICMKENCKQVYIGEKKNAEV